MLLGRVQFSDKVSIIADPGSPPNFKLALADTIFNPMEPHVHRLGPLWFDRVVGQADSTLIVRSD